MNWLRQSDTVYREATIACLEELICTKPFNGLETISRNKVYFKTKQSLFYNPFTQREEKAFVEQMIYSRKSDKSINQENIARIKQVLGSAIDDYVFWSRNKTKLKDSRNGVRYGLFTEYRHGQTGIRNAQAFRNDIVHSGSPEDVINHIDNFLNSYIKIGGKYHNHSCASFILIALCYALPGSHWEYITDKTVTPVYRF
ncbi:MAG: hypothetical protein LRY67_02380 [Gammaproteobacteria bacterium]|nr:hypothetical protein [Gammaproteobacteria bacterium]MCD8542043.1 hypothetical protein [Gammaproteobacteria bacterium]